MRKYLIFNYKIIIYSNLLPIFKFDKFVEVTKIFNI